MINRSIDRITTCHNSWSSSDPPSFDSLFLFSTDIFFLEGRNRRTDLQPGKKPCPSATNILLVGGGLYLRWIGGIGGCVTHPCLLYFAGFCSGRQPLFRGFTYFFWLFLAAVQPLLKYVCCCCQPLDSCMWSFFGCIGSPIYFFGAFFGCFWL